jgi:glycosyltransferase involved in cell wall biosynthesis
VEGPGYPLSGRHEGTHAPRIVAIVPCYNEEAAVAKVVADLSNAVPGITVYVYDNNSTDETAFVAAKAGAVVRTERLKGKGNVVRRAFADIDADIYVLIDGDDTYDATATPTMIAALRAGPLDHVLGCRQLAAEKGAHRPGHELGNRMFNHLVGVLFGQPVTDMLSGFRVLSRRFVKSFPALSREFEIETELTVHTMNLRVPQAEIPVGFRDRPDGSESKLRTYHDGFRILRLIAQLLQHERPVVFYGLVSAVIAILGLILGIPVVWEFSQTGLVTRQPTAVLASSLMLIAIMGLVVGLILNGVLRARKEAVRLEYLRWEPPSWIRASWRPQSFGRQPDPTETDPRDSG